MYTTLSHLNINAIVCDHSKNNNLYIHIYGHIYVRLFVVHLFEQMKENNYFFILT